MFEDHANYQNCTIGEFIVAIFVAVHVKESNHLLYSWPLFLIFMMHHYDCSKSCLTHDDEVWLLGVLCNR
jgi:hypothetical protein